MRRPLRFGTLKADVVWRPQGSKSQWTLPEELPSREPPLPELCFRAKCVSLVCERWNG